MCRQTSTHPHCLVVSTTRYLTNQDSLVPDPRACAFHSFCKLRSEHDCKPVLRAVYIELQLKEKILSLLLPRTYTSLSLPFTALNLGWTWPLPGPTLSTGSTWSTWSRPAVPRSSRCSSSHCKPVPNRAHGFTMCIQLIIVNTSQVRPLILLIQPCWVVCTRLPFSLDHNVNPHPTPRQCGV